MRHPVYDALQSVLAGDATLVSLLGNGVASIIADQADDPRLPAIRYALITDPMVQRLKSGEHLAADVQIDVYADRGDSSKAWTIDRRIRALLDRQPITITGFNGGQPMCIGRGRPFKEQGVYRITSDYRIYGTKT